MKTAASDRKMFKRYSATSFLRSITSIFNLLLENVITFVRKRLFFLRRKILLIYEKCFLRKRDYVFLRNYAEIIFATNFCYVV